MKKIRIVFLSIFMFGFIHQLYGQDPNFHIYLCFGQSNMAGAGEVETRDSLVNARFLAMSTNDCPEIGRTKYHWYSAVPPLSGCGSGLSPADYFGRTMVDSLPSHVRVGVINVSVPGCKIELFIEDSCATYLETAPDWMIGIVENYDHNPYNYLVTLAKLAQKDGVIKGILLHQGESNPNDSLWSSKVATIYTNLITDLSLEPGDVPLLAGETVHADQGGKCAAMNAIISTLPETLPNSHIISSAGCESKPDKLHFTSAGNRELGRRYAAQMLTILAQEKK